jgi:hypothetical protein
MQTDFILTLAWDICFVSTGYFQIYHRIEVVVVVRLHVSNLYVCGVRWKFFSQLTKWQRHCTVSYKML